MIDFALPFLSFIFRQLKHACDFVKFFSHKIVSTQEQNLLTFRLL